MTHRIAAPGGTISVESTPGRGTVIGMLPAPEAEPAS